MTLSPPKFLNATPVRAASKPRRSTFWRDNFSGSFCRVGWGWLVGSKLKLQGNKISVLELSFLLNYLFCFICFIKPLFWGAKLAQRANAMICSEALG